ncbi:MAG: RNase adapter RapZ [Deltaproteobacteria bacterium]|nr:RNase adapter RapZ [Deltaproteobacteria bacterium]
MSQGHRIVLVTGVSGGGKSTAIKALEDAGWFCIDNLPVLLLPKLFELAGMNDEIERFALVVDARESRYLDQAPATIEDVRRAGHRVEIVFLDCADEALLRRFSETRRRHPLSLEGTVADGIAAERALLEPLRQLADSVIDTTRMTVHELRAAITARFGAIERDDSVNVTLQSFGFRHGLPAASDFVFDVRFLPNPYFVPELREHTGLEAQVSSYVLEKPAAQELLKHVEALLAFVLPQVRAEGKTYLTVSIGCTGGKHRSVALVEELARRLSAHGVRARTAHRDAQKS